LIGARLRRGDPGGAAGGGPGAQRLDQGGILEELNAIETAVQGVSQDLHVGLREAGGVQAGDVIDLDPPGRDAVPAHPGFTSVEQSPVACAEHHNAAWIGSGLIARIGPEVGVDGRRIRGSDLA
jgi:hypothetical protein